MYTHLVEYFLLLNYVTRIEFIKIRFVYPGGDDDDDDDEETNEISDGSDRDPGSALDLQGFLPAPPPPTTTAAPPPPPKQRFDLDRKYDCSL